jgi:2-dehydropantoate 2-reductase
MKIALLGAGSVGQAYGYHLAQGGAEITFLVRPKYREALAEGVDVYPLNRPRRGRWQALRFSGFAVVDKVADLSADTDQIWLCVPLTGLDDDQVTALAQRAPKATIITMMSNLSVRQRLLALIEPERLVFGLITLTGFQAPLPGAAPVSRGEAWWFPPGGPTLFSGARAGRAVAALRAGSAPAKSAKDVVRRTSMASAVLIPMIAGLELSGWSLRALRRSTELGRVGAAIAAIHAALGAEFGGGPGLIGLARHPALLRLVLWGAVKVPPFDLEVFFEKHFTKVGAQTEVMLADWIDRGRQAQKDITAIEELLQRLRAARRR